MRLVVARCSVDYAGRLSAHLPLATRLVLTEIDDAPDGDTFFPEWPRSEWTETTRVAGETTPELAFVTWDRI